MNAALVEEGRVLRMQNRHCHQEVEAAHQDLLHLQVSFVNVGQSGILLAAVSQLCVSKQK